MSDRVYGRLFVRTPNWQLRREGWDLWEQVAIGTTRNNVFVDRRGVHVRAFGWDWRWIVPTYNGPLLLNERRIPKRWYGRVQLVRRGER